MATSARTGAGILFQRGNGSSPQTFTTIAEVTQVPNFGEKKDLIEVTHLQSTRKEFIGGLADGAEITIPMNYNPDNVTHQGIKTDYTNNTQRDFKLLFTTGEYWLLTAIIIGWDLNIEPNAAVIQNMTIKITGNLEGPLG